MGKFDASIDWLRRQIANAAEAIADLKGGHKIEINDKNVTAELMAAYERMIARYKQLIGAYEKHDE
jgi:hypothetical protein